MLKKIIIILSLIIVLFILWMVKQKWFSFDHLEGNITVQYEDIDPGRLVLGKKITIRDGVKIPLTKFVILKGTTPTILGNIDLGMADNLYRKVSETVYIEEGYRSDQIKSAERIDTVENGNIKSSHLRIQLALPDTVQCFGINAREQNIAPFFIGFLPGPDAEAKLDTIKKELIIDGYHKWRNEWMDSLQENLEYTALTMSNYLNEAARIAQWRKFDSIESQFEFEYEGQLYNIKIRCDSEGNCSTVQRDIGQNLLQ